MSRLLRLARTLTIAGALGAMTCTGAGVAAAAPVEPLFVRAIDGYSPYQGQTSCYSELQPGVEEFRTYFLAAYPGTYNASDVRACSGGQSEHKDGRAWDWGIPDGYQAKAEEALAWLLAPDEYGNPNANLRRLGIMYVIWNHRVFMAWEADRGWQPYSGDNPHTDHVHFSFGWDGALEKTSWFTGVQEGLLLNQAGYGATRRDKKRLDVVRLSASGQIEQRTHQDRAWDTWHSLGGAVTAAPSAAWTSGSSFWVFGLGTSGQVVYRRWKADVGWGDWRSFGKDVTSGVGVSASKGRIDLVVRSTSGSTLYRQWTSKHRQLRQHRAAADGAVAARVTGSKGWSSWKDLGGTNTSAPTILRQRSRIDVIARDSTGALHQATKLRGEKWQKSWPIVGTGTTSGPTLASMDGGTFSIFVRGTGGEVRNGAYNGAWSWSPVGGYHVSAPTAAGERNRLDLFTRSADGRLAQNSWIYGTGWVGWAAQERTTPPTDEARPPAATDDPAVVIEDDDGVRAWPLPAGVTLAVPGSDGASVRTERGLEYERVTASVTRVSDADARDAAAAVLAALDGVAATPMPVDDQASAWTRRVVEPANGGNYVTVVRVTVSQDHVVTVTTSSAFWAQVGP